MVKKLFSNLMGKRINNKDKLIEALKINAKALEFTTKELQDDRDVVLTAVQNNGYSLKFASKRLKNDKEIALIAMETNC